MAVQSEVFLYVYDLSKGNAKALSSLFLGKEFPGIWHTSVTVYDREYFFGGFGIQSCMAGTTNYGVPEQIIPMGHTEIPYNLFLEYLSSLGDSVFTPTSYDIFNHNCNNFTNEITIFLTGKGIPEEILNLPSEFLSMPLIRTLLSSFNISPSETGVSFHQPSGNSFANNTINNNSSDKETHKPTSSTSPVHLKSNHIDSDNNSSPPIKSEASFTPSAVNEMSEEPQEPRIASKNEDEEQENEKDSSGFVSSARRSYKYDDPPIIFKEIDGIAALKKVEEMVVNLLNPRQQELLKEIGEYLQSDSGAWAIGDEHLDLIAYLLNGGDGKFAPNVTLLTLEVLQAASLKEDVVLILHQDRKDHRIMSYINKIENLTLAEQEEIVKLLCNLCGQPSSFDWLLYISEWCEENGQPNSNSRVTIRAAVHTLLNDQLTTLQRNGVYLIYNLSLKEVFEDVSIELATAVLQYMHSDLPDDQALLCLTAITRFIDISMNDVPALIKMLGPDLNKYKGKNEKMDKLIQEIGNRVDRLPSFS